MVLNKRWKLWSARCGADQKNTFLNCGAIRIQRISLEISCHTYRACGSSMRLHTDTAGHKTPRKFGMPNSIPDVFTPIITYLGLRVAQHGGRIGLVRAQQVLAKHDGNVGNAHAVQSSKQEHPQGIHFRHRTQSFGGLEKRWFALIRLHESYEAPQRRP